MVRTGRILTTARGAGLRQRAAPLNFGVPRLQRASISRAVTWLVATLFCALFAAAAPPRAATIAHESPGRPASASVGVGRDLGKALVRATNAITIAAPAPEPLPPLAQPHRALRLTRPNHPTFDGARLATVATTAQVVRWRRRIPRMDSGEPPRSDAFAS